jgi:hypothetical protein
MRSTRSVIERIAGWTRTREKREATFHVVTKDRIRRLHIRQRPRRKIANR